MRILFMGTPDIAADCLKALYEAGHDICAVYTRRDKPVGRKQVLTAPPGKEVALAHGTPVFQPRTLRDGGHKKLCQRPEQLAEILAALRAARLEPKRLAFVKNRPNGAPWLFLVEAQKGRRTGLRVEPDVLITSGAAMYGPKG